MADILVVDDDQSIGTALERFITREGHRCRVASNAQDALVFVDAHRPDLVFMDIRMPGVDGLEALEVLRGHYPSLLIVIMTAHGTSQTSIDAMRAGAFEYVTKPFDLDELRAVLVRALAANATSAPPAADEADAAPDVILVGDSPAMREIYKLIGTLAANAVPALLLGERGTGKELVAATIHRNSTRRNDPFMAVDCALLPPESLEAELSVEGVGTLYLAEVHALPRLAQARLTRIIARRNGAAVARVIAASEKNLEEYVESGAFSRELFEQLSVITLRLPPLRSRLGDLPALVQHLLKRFSVELNHDIHGVEDQVMSRFSDYSWPGNVQELATILKRAVIVGRGSRLTLDQVEAHMRGSAAIDRGDIDAGLARAARLALEERLVDMQTGAESSVFHDIVGFVESTLVREALSITNNNQVKASELLGVNRATLRKKATLSD
jgi:DNA-binding NtrC family response regulator